MIFKTHLLDFEKEIDIKGLYTFFYYEHGTKFCFNGEKHDFWEMVYVDKGEISVVAENNGYLLKQGNVIFHKPMEFHALASTHDLPHNIIVVTFETQSPAMDFFKNKILKINSSQKKILSLFLEEMKNAFHRFAVTYDDADTLSPEQKESYQLAVGYLEEFLIKVKRENLQYDKNINRFDGAKKNIENAIVQSIKKYLEDNIYENLSLQDVCRHFNLSKSYICRLFKNDSDKTLIDSYIDMKISEAKLLIRQGNLNFTEISEKLGYGSIHHFSRSFKSKTGMSPSEYEKSVL